VPELADSLGEVVHLLRASRLNPYAVDDLTHASLPLRFLLFALSFHDLLQYLTLTVRCCHLSCFSAATCWVLFLLCDPRLSALMKREDVWEPVWRDIVRRYRSKLQVSQHEAAQVEDLRDLKRWLNA
jgi:hypothetical protein